MNSSSPLFASFSNYPELVIGLSTKKDGSMRIGVDGTVNELCVKNRTSFFQSLNIRHEDVVSAQLVHGNVVHNAVAQQKNMIIPGVDSFVTQEQDIYISVTVADCLPIFLYDPVRKAVGIVHAGWRGLVNGIIKKTILTMQDQCGSDPRHIRVGIGPGLGVCHFEIKEDVASLFHGYLNGVENKNNKHFLHSTVIARQQLCESNVPEDNIEVSSHCTFCEQALYYSYRRDKPEVVQAMVAVIGIKKISNRTRDNNVISKKEEI